MSRVLTNQRPVFTYLGDDRDGRLPQPCCCLPVVLKPPPPDDVRHHPRVVALLPAGLWKTQRPHSLIPLDRSVHLNERDVVVVAPQLKVGPGHDLVHLPHLVMLGPAVGLEHVAYYEREVRGSDLVKAMGSRHEKLLCDQGSRAKHATVLSPDLNSPGMGACNWSFGSLQPH